MASIIHKIAVSLGLTISLALASVQAPITPQSQMVSEAVNDYEITSIQAVNSPFIEASDHAAKSEVAALIYQYAILYNAPFEELLMTIQGESNFKMVYGDEGLAYGYAQFHQGTFKLFANEMGFDGANYYNGEDQIKVMAWAFSRGETYKRHWTVWRGLFGIMD